MAKPGPGCRSGGRLWQRHRKSTPAPGCNTAKGVGRGDVGRAFLPGPSWSRTRPPRGLQRESGGRGPAKCRIYYIPATAANSILPARRRWDHAATATCNLTGDIGDSYPNDVPPGVSSVSHRRCLVCQCVKNENPTPFSRPLSLFSTNVSRLRTRPVSRSFGSIG